MDSLTNSTKTRLHEVSNGMLLIYKTLARMRYLDPSLIREGPHPIDELLPMYHSYNLDPAVIYLYSILPYVDADHLDEPEFFQSGTFADFRLKEHVERGRDPFYADSEDEAMRPWMTPLSLLGNHGTVILYDTKRHRIGMYDQESCGSTDHNLYEGVIFLQPGQQGEEENTDDGREEEDEEGTEDDEHDEEEDDEEADEEEDEDEEEDIEGENIYDEMDSRPAANVLRDIVKWYNELVETPRRDERDLLTPAYRKNGWPTETFDGDAFLVDLARAKAAEAGEYVANEPKQNATPFKEPSDNMIYLQRKLAEATTLDGEWTVRWQLWRQEIRDSWYRKRQQEVAAWAVIQEQYRIPEDLPLFELWELREKLASAQLGLAALQQQRRELEAAQPEAEGLPEVLRKLRHAEEQVRIYQKACEASHLDAERLCPGRAEGFRPVPVPRPEPVSIERLQQEAQGIQDWMAELPDGADGARKEAQEELDRYAYNIEQRIAYQRQEEAKAAEQA